ncbi:peptide ABC transporter permease [Neobacillus sp. D3-1R]|uniref:peptide ABC transporter permease n=1 Tax=Neobacillus sp. D3-1R TaxID=3445778 RepID=UPI003FA093D7
MRNKTLIIGMTMFLSLLFITIVGPYLPFVDHDLEGIPFLKNQKEILAPPFPPSDDFLLGSDRKGRDYVSVLIIGAKETMVTILIITCFCFLLAVPFGVGATKSRIVYQVLVAWNYLFSRVPNLFVIILITNIPLFMFSSHRSIYFVVIIAILEIGKIADIFKQQIDIYNQSPVVHSGIVSGNSGFGMFKRYYLPELMPQIILTFVLHFGKILFLIGQLGIFSIFVSQEFVQIEGGIPGHAYYEIRNTSLIWSAHLSNILDDIRDAPWIPFYAAGLITYTLMTFNLLGEGLRAYFQTRHLGMVSKEKVGIFRLFSKNQSGKNEMMGA